MSQMSEPIPGAVQASARARSVRAPAHDPLSFARALSARLIEELRLGPDDLVVDLCCGAGAFACSVLDQIRLRNQLLAVDASRRALEGVPPRDDLRLVEMDAFDFAAFPVRYDKILFKDALPAIAPADRSRLLASLRERLGPGGILLVANTAPRRDRSLFARASRRLAAEHVAPDTILDPLFRAGFRVRRSAFEHSSRVPLDHYCRLIEDRYVPVLAGFSDRELRNGVAEIRRHHAGRDAVEYVERVDLFAATPAASAV